jgi:murein L,D-transpeptidase YcbB/YkuD
VLFRSPPFLQYGRLRDKLAEYRSIAAQGGWPRIEPGRTLKPGLHDPRVPTIRERLTATGELPAGGTSDSTEYDQIVMEAVKQFQRHHGLEPDGNLGRSTLAAMNVPVAQRINQIIVNLESWRWVERDPGDWFLVVNIPSFELQGIRNNKVEISRPVIVGEQYSTKMTPVFSDSIRYVEFNPYWNVPKTIARREMLPELKKDPSYLKKKNIRLFEGDGPNAPEIDSSAVDWDGVSPQDMDRYHLRQDPGPDNSLGTVELAFPNQFDVYLHDTPAKDLFRQPRRAFSHGCIRVAEAQVVAAYVLGGQANGWDEDRVKALIDEGKDQIVHLDPSVPIYILYHTAVVNPDNNEIYFYDDVYGRDAILEKALF